MRESEDASQELMNIKAGLESLAEVGCEQSDKEAACCAIGEYHVMSKLEALEPIPLPLPKEDTLSNIPSRMKFSLLLFSLAVAATIAPHVHGAYRYSSPNAFYFDKDLATVDSYGSSLPWDVLSAKTDDKAEVDLTFRVLKCSQHLGPKIFLHSPKILVVTKGCLLVEIAEENSRPFTGEPSFSFMLKPGQTGYVPQGLPHIEKSVDCGYGHYNDTEYYTYFPKRKHSVKILDALKDFEKLMVVSAFNSKYEDVETVLAA